MKTNILWLLMVPIVAIAFTACNTNKNIPKDNAWYIPNNKTGRGLNELVGYKEGKVLQLYGKPKYLESFVFKPQTRLPEYDSGLYELLKFKNEKEKKYGIPVKRMVWIKGDLNRIIWLRKQEDIWVVVDGILIDTSKIQM